jgi:hypothetical protein
MLFDRSSLPLSRSTVEYLSGVLRRHRKQVGWKTPSTASENPIPT